MIARTALLDTTGWQRALVVLALTTAGAAFVALAAQAPGIPNPLVPAIPITLQVLAVALVGMVLGSKLGALAIVEYLVIGLAGLPVFSNAGSGLVRLLGPTGGFLIGFVLMAFVIGLIMEGSAKPGRLRAFVAGLAGLVPLYLLGAAWFGVLIALAASGVVPQTFPGTETTWVSSGLASGLGASFGEALLPALGKAWALTVAGFIVVDALKVLVAALVFQGGRELVARIR
jgi:biotin transport system substrate-specific component